MFALLTQASWHVAKSRELQGMALLFCSFTWNTYYKVEENLLTLLLLVVVFVVADDLKSFWVTATNTTNAKLVANLKLGS